MCSDPLAPLSRASRCVLLKAGSVIADTRRVAAGRLHPTEEPALPLCCQTPAPPDRHLEINLQVRITGGPWQIDPEGFLLEITDPETTHSRGGATVPERLCTGNNDATVLIGLRQGIQRVSFKHGSAPKRQY
mgnify:CR=1 FL=1